MFKLNFACTIDHQRSRSHITEAVIDLVIINLYAISLHKLTIFNFTHCIITIMFNYILFYFFIHTLVLVMNFIPLPCPFAHEDTLLILSWGRVISPHFWNR